MKFMVSLITDGTQMQGLSEEEMREMGERMMAFMGEIADAGVLVNTGRLAPEARTLRYGERGEAVATDGPFAETKEQVAGYMVLDCADLDEAFDWARRLPVAGGAVEVRPISDYDAAGGKP